MSGHRTATPGGLRAISLLVTSFKLELPNAVIAKCREFLET